MMDSATTRSVQCNATTRAFTLIELLVVIAIIALLVSILMPSLTRAKALARQTVCTVNQSNIAKALILYSESNGCYPVNFGTNYWSNPASGFSYAYAGGALGYEYERWALATLNPYISGESINSISMFRRKVGSYSKNYLCPSADETSIYTSVDGLLWSALASYWTSPVIRQNRGMRGAPDLWGQGLWYPTPRGKPGDDRNSYWKMRVSGSFCEGPYDDVRPNTPPKHWRTIYQPTSDSVSIPGETIFTGDSTDIEHWSSYNAHHVKPGEFRGIAPGVARVHEFLGFRHMSKMIVGYVDGHVSNIREDAFIGGRADVDYATFNNLYLDDDGETCLTTGEFWISFGPKDSCYYEDVGVYSRIHNLAPRFGDHE